MIMSILRKHLFKRVWKRFNAEKKRQELFQSVWDTLFQEQKPPRNLYRQNGLDSAGKHFEIWYAQRLDQITEQYRKKYTGIKSYG